MEVEFRDCLSSSCDRWIKSECKVSLEQGALVVSSLGSKKRSLRFGCTDDCGLAPAARCRLAGDISPGRYTLKFNDQMLDQINYPLDTKETCWDRNKNWKVDVGDGTK